MARISSSRGRSIGGGGFRATPRSGGFRGPSFHSRTSTHIGGYRRYYQPYRRNYIFYRLGPVGKVIYLIVIGIILFALMIWY